METEQYLSAVERSVQQKFRFREQLSWLVDNVKQQGMEAIFEDILFFSKFLSHAYIVLKREGVESDTLGNLKNEFSVNLEKTHTLLRTIIKDAPEPERGEFIARFLAMTPGCMENFLALTKELTWIKNYNLDQART